MKKLLSVALSLSLILSMLVFTVSASTEASATDTLYRIEAETGERGGVASIVNDSAASGSRYVGGLGGSTSEQSSYVTMTAIMPRAGIYTMKIAVKSSTEHAASSGSGNNLSINGADPVTLSYTVSDSFIIHEERVSLNEGENTIKLSGIPGSRAWAQVDYIEFDLSEYTVKIEAETGELSGAAIGTNGNPSGGYCVGGLGGTSDSERNAYVLMNVTAPAAGRYKMSLAVNSSDSATVSGHNLTINDADPITLSYPCSSAYVTVDVMVELKEGDNAVKISGIPGSNAWARIDYIELDFAQSINRYEAEDGVLTDTAKAYAESYASGGYKVGGLGGTSEEEQNASVTMTVNVPRAATYTVKIRTRSASGATTGHNLSINGGEPETLYYASSADYIYHTVLIDLNSGDNTVKISGVPGSGAWGFLDCIDVYVPTSLYEEPDVVKVYEAEDGILTDTAEAYAESYASGGYKVGGLGGTSEEEQNASVTMTVNVPRTAAYIVKIRTRSAEGATTGHNLSVNGGEPKTLYYASSADYIYHTVLIDLNSGDNTVKISGVPGSGAWGFLDCIEVYVPAEYYDPTFNSFGVTLNEGITVRTKLTITAEWLAANPDATVKFSTGDEFEPLVGANYYYVTLTPGYIGTDLTVTCGELSKVVSVDEYVSKIKAMSSSALGISDAKYEKLLALLDAIVEYGEAADKTTEGVTADFSGIGSYSTDNCNSVITSIGGSLDTFANIKLGIDESKADSFTAQMGDKIIEGTVAGHIEDGFLCVRNLRPGDFNEEITITLLKEGSEVASISLSFNEYLASAYDSADSNMKNVIAAAYNYGVAFEAYVSAE